MKKTDINLIPDIQNPTPDYYCTWQTQLYATNDGKPDGQRAIIGEKTLFNKEKPNGWAYFYEKIRGDLFIVMDDSWDIPLNNDMSYLGSLVLSKEKFPLAVKNAKSNAQAMKNLSDRIKSLGWKGLGGWVCAQESSIFNESADQKEYWIKRLKEANEAGFLYWKVDWGNWGGDVEFRKMLTKLGRKFAPELIIEHAITPGIIPYCDTFRTYDVPAIMSVPMTMEKISQFTDIGESQEGNMCLLNCEDEAYISAACGFAMGIMRHPYSGPFINGKSDMSFPAVHRNLKTKMYEIIRAVRWHRIAPAFAFESKQLKVSEKQLFDTWVFEKTDEEIEKWWFDHPAICKCLDGGILKKCAPSALVRNTEIPKVDPDVDGQIPFVVAAQNPNGAFSVATMGRTIQRNYYIPLCDIMVKSGASKIIGVFGEYKNLIIETELEDIKRVLMQDLADCHAFDITDMVNINHCKVIISGELISKIGTALQPENDTSEPGAVILFETV